MADKNYWSSLSDKKPSEHKITRRNYLKLMAAGAAVVVVGAGGGYYLYNQLAPKPPEPLVIVQWGGPYVESQNPLVAEFTQQTGIPVTVELHAGFAAAIIAKIQADMPKVTRDVVNAFGPVFLQMDAQGWLANLTPDNIPSMSQLAEAAYVKSPISGNTIALAGWEVQNIWAYRDDLVPKDLQPLDSYEKFLDPRLKGRVGITDCTGGGGCIAWLPALEYGGDEHNIQPGFDYLKKLANAGNIGLIYSTEAQIISAMTSGQIWIAELAAGDAYNIYKNGVSMRRDRNKGILSTYFPEGICLMKDSPRMDEAYKWANFFLDAPNNSRFTAGIGLASTNTNVKVDPTILLFSLAAGELSEFGHAPDLPYIIAHQADWQKQFESDILPLVKT